MLVTVRGRYRRAEVPLLEARVQCLGLGVVQSASQSAPPARAVGRFVGAYGARYGDEEVPLLEALDEDTGISFEQSRSPSAEAAPLVQGLSFPVAESSARFGPRVALLLRRVEAIQR